MTYYSALYQNRINWLKIIIYLVATVFLVKIVNFQIFRYAYYSKIAERNKTQIIARNAPRGRIFSADKVMIAGNKPSFTLAYFPLDRENYPEPQKICVDISRYLDIPVSEVSEKIYSAIKRNVPVKIAAGLSSREMLKISELKTFYPGLNIISEAGRFYPMHNFLSHIVGYLGKINPKEWEYYKSRNYSMDAYVGKAGLEKRFEQELKGVDGGMYLEVDSKGRLIQVLESRKSLPGADIYLTIDSRIQKAAEDGLKESLSGEGAVVAVNPQNGKILAIADYPNFDPGRMLKGKVGGDTQEFNLAAQGSFPPGSVFKIVVSAAALELGSVDINRKFYCPGYFDAGARVFRCWKKEGHRRVAFYDGFAHSCDVYFYHVGLLAGPYNIEKFSKMFGLGRKTGVEIDNESKGNIFGPGARVKNKKYWFIGDTLNLSIGQGELLVTPMQMAQMISAVANGGKFWRPYYVEKVVDRNGRRVFSRSAHLQRKIRLKQSTWLHLRKALSEVVEKGTGRAAKISGAEVFGKTGTAQNPHGSDHAWFVSYAQVAGRPSEIAVAVLVAFGEHGASAAAPIARKVMEAALKEDLNRSVASGRRGASDRNKGR